MDNKSTKTANQTLLESVQEALDRQLHVVGLFLDLSKAYDVINHNILLDTLDSYGIRGSSNLWFKSYLEFRTQYVEITNTDTSNSIVWRYSSSPMDISHGVLQGSILGPLLFLVYINDLPLNIQEVEVVLYADDINILVIHKKRKLYNLN
jgi:hypothetical protein